MSFTLVMLPPASEVTETFGDRLRRDVPGITVLSPRDEAEAALALREADAAYGRLSPGLVRQAVRLRWLQAPQAAPPAGFYSQELIEHPAVVTNMRGTYTGEVAAHAVALALALARGLPRYAAQQHRHEWRQHLDRASYLDLTTATTLIVGMGGVGAEIARLLRPFGGPVIATDARVQAAPEWVDELHPAADLDAVLPRADLIIVTVPHTPATEGLFSAARFALVKPGARLVNIGRGPVVDLGDLVAAIGDGQIGGAALDVYQAEPLPAGHPLWDLPEVILTPHIASAPDGKDPLRPARYEVLLDNARRFAAGEPLRNLVDKASWF